MQVKRSMILAVAILVMSISNLYALDVYIPHISAGANDWTDYLQANNTDVFASSFTLTLYAGGVAVYSQSHNVPGLTRLEIDLKALSSTAETGVVTYQASGLHFKFSTQNEGGGLAEFSLSSSLGSTVAFQYSDFTDSIVTKGAVVANFSNSNLSVKLYAIGAGIVFDSYSAEIDPYGKLMGVHSDWFPEVPFFLLEQVLVVSQSSTLAGFVICGDADLSHLLFAQAAVADDFDSSYADSMLGETGGGCVDADGDGYFSTGGCGSEIDCDDTDSTVHPGAPEICGDSIDQNCDGSDQACSTGLADLTITNVDEISLPTAQGEILSVEFDVMNEGLGSCSTGSITYYICHWTTSGGLVDIESKEAIGSAALSTIQPGSTEHVTFTYKIPFGTEADDYWLLIEVSEGASGTGTVAGNNEYSVEFSIGSSNLVIIRESFTSEPEGPGDLLRFEYTILNTGVKANPQMTIEYYMEGTTVKAIGTATLGSIDPGASATKTFSYSIPSNQPKGDYELIVSFTGSDNGSEDREYRFSFDI